VPLLELELELELDTLPEALPPVPLLELLEAPPPEPPPLLLLELLALLLGLLPPPPEVLPLPEPMLLEPPAPDDCPVLGEEPHPDRPAIATPVHNAPIANRWLRFIGLPPLAHDSLARAPSVKRIS
jgi:hypothetical protein